MNVKKLSSKNNSYTTLEVILGWIFKHIRQIRLQGAIHNNKMERLNGEIRDREKTMRGLKKKRTVMLSGYQLFHNFIRPHEALGGKTPSEACGIMIGGQNKWKTLIQNASKNKSTTS